MSDNLGRIFGMCAAMALMWVVVYWVWEPSEPRISFDAERPTPIEAAADQATAAEGAATSRTERRRAAARAAEQQPPQLAVLPPSFREYTVQEGDTLSGIAARELGSARYADAISRANPYVNMEQMRAGRVIFIPRDPSNIQGLPVATAPPPRVPTPSQDAEPQMAEYTVRAGDTLSRIALAQYGSTRYANLIFEANRDQMRSIDHLSVGQKLRLPPKPD